MRYFVASAFICVCLFALKADIFGQEGEGCVGGKRFGIYFTDCFPWEKGDGYIANTNPLVRDDTERLRRAIGDGFRKLIFNEANYKINEELELYSYLVLEGTSVNTTTERSTSYITQTEPNLSIFKVAPDEIYTNQQNQVIVPIIQEIAIRDIGLRGDSSLSGYGIHATGGANNAPGLFFQFTNVRFTNFKKAIFVDATDYSWQFDSVRLDKCYFEGNTIGVHVNSMNSGWTISGINMKVPQQVLATDPETMGFFFERSTYTSLNMITGNGPEDFNGTKRATVFVKIIRHGNISIQNAVSEGFKHDLIIEGVDTTTRNFPIALINNHFMHGIKIKDSTVTSTGNQFGYGNKAAEVIASGDSQIYSFGDKFCFEGVLNCIHPGEDPVSTADDFDYSNYRTIDNARLISIADNSIGFGKLGSWFKMGRSEIDGSLTFASAVQGFGFTFDANYSSYTVKNGNLNFTNGTITLGTSGFADLNLGTTTPGTMYHCPDCQMTNPCQGGGDGAIAKLVKTLAGVPPPNNKLWVCN